jgi:prephenate dehydrogenase
VMLTTPEEHDRQMAASQALTHFIGAGVRDMGVGRLQLSTRTFERLMDIIETIRKDSPALFEDMQMMNPFAQEMRRRFIEAATMLDKRLTCG